MSCSDSSEKNEYQFQLTKTSNANDLSSNTTTSMKAAIDDFTPCYQPSSLNTSESITKQLLDIAQSYYVIPPYMLQDSTPNIEKKKLVIPLLCEVLKYAQVKVGAKLHYIGSELGMKSHVKVIFMSKEECTLKWENQAYGEIFPVEQFQKNPHLWKQLFIGRKSVFSWFLSLICFRVHTIVRDIDGVISFGKTWNQTLPIRFVLCVNEKEKERFSVLRHITDYCDIEYTVVPRWSNDK